MELILVFSFIFIMGFVAAIPAGPVQIEVVRRSVHGHLKPSLMVILGAFMVDMLYGVVAFFGIAPFLRNPVVMSVFWLSGSIILAVLGVLSIRHSRRTHHAPRWSAYLSRKRWSLLSGFSLSVANPVMVLWWLTGLHIMEDLGLAPVFTTTVTVSYLLAGSLGLASYLIALTFILYRMKDFISLSRMRQINTAFGVLLLGLAGYFFFHAAKAFIG
ncbi:MAG: hypothetical protein EPN25_00570 [Nitrospirae bacterium]|nr:MAG: hypothetical protein EPN25_00570 [Nitrospirota bacterium]